MNNGATLRLAAPTDAAAIAQLYLTTRKQLLPYAPLAHPDEEVRQWIANHLLTHSGVTVAEVNGEIMGFCATTEDGTFGWIDQLYLLPSAVGQGIGTALLADALHHLRFPVRLYTFQANSGARRFYERHGFVTVALGDGTGNEEGAPDVLYERGLPLTIPTLETDRLLLRAITPDDTPAMLRLGSDPQVMRYLTLPPMTTLGDAAYRVNALNSEFQQQTGIRWAVTLRQQPEMMIGTCGYRQFMKSHFRAELGYMLAADFWGQGLAPEACRAVLDFGFSHLGLHSVEAQIDPNNRGSQRVLEKLGFVREAYFRENYYFAAEQRFGDTAIYGLLKAEWQRQQPK